MGRLNSLLFHLSSFFCSDQRLAGLRREYQQTRAAPGYEELDAARRRVLEYDPQRVSAPACMQLCGYEY